MTVVQLKFYRFFAAAAVVSNMTHVPCNGCTACCQYPDELTTDELDGNVVKAARKLLEAEKKA
jgi:hypothetical protein